MAVMYFTTVVWKLLHAPMVICVIANDWICFAIRICFLRLENLFFYSRPPVGNAGGGLCGCVPSPGNACRGLFCGLPAVGNVCRGLFCRFPPSGGCFRGLCRRARSAGQYSQGLGWCRRRAGLQSQGLFSAPCRWQPVTLRKDSIIGGLGNGWAEKIGFGGGFLRFQSWKTIWQRLSAIRKVRR